MKKKAKITERLILSFVLIGFISIASVSVLTYFSSRDALLERSFEQLNSIKLLKKRQVEKFLADRVRDVALLGRSNDVIQLIQRLKENDTTGLNSDSFIYEYARSSVYLDTLIFSDFSTYRIQTPGEIYLKPVDSTMGLTLPHAAEALNNPEDLSLYDYNPAASGRPLLCAASPVLGAGYRTDGFVALVIAPEHINEIMLESISGMGFGLSGESYLVGADRLMRSSSRFIGNSIMQTQVRTEAVDSAFASGDGIMITEDYRGVKVLSSFCTLDIQGLDWVLLSEIDLKEVMAPVNRLRNQLLLLSMVLIIGVFLAAWFLSLRISAPVIRIKEAALQISTGEFPTVNEMSNNDEINELVQTFNYMSGQLREKKIQLELEQHKHMTAVFDGQEQERRRLSQELHDGLGQMLAGLKFKIESLEMSGKDTAGGTLPQLREAVAEAINEVRHMSFNLMPAILSRFGLVKALSSLCHTMQEQTGTPINFDADGDCDTSDTRLAGYIFRIVQEAVNNAIRHGKPTQVSVQLIEFGQFYTIIIEDNGSGFVYDPLLPPTGNGLYNMQERTTLLGGRFIIQSEPGNGTIIRIKIPKINTLNEMS